MKKKIYVFWGSFGGEKAINEKTISWARSFKLYYKKSADESGQGRAERSPLENFEFILINKKSISVRFWEKMALRRDPAHIWKRNQGQN